jgi:ribosomal protein L12E/L44/L45/RPP1/RPP2
MALSIDRLMPLIEASPLLEQVEGGLRRAGKKGQADKLLKLQQDAGIEVEKAFGTYDASAGSQTARLDKAYEEVTPARFNTVLQTAHAALPEGDLKTTLGMLNDKLLLPETLSAPAKQKKPGM